MEDRWLSWVKRLQSIASTGKHFTEDPFDRERYDEIGAIAARMIAALADSPVEKLPELVADFGTGYATPKVEVRAAVFDAGKILLVRELTDGLWAMPGGFADVGRSAGENIEKEVWEEAGLAVRATALYAVRHKAKHAYRPDIRDFYKLYFHCERMDARAPTPGSETSEAAYFSIDALPPLSRGRTIESDIHAAVEFLQDPARSTRFD
jgi:ADP-ribose pyrophosphatase YjhB (NUDIX family)